MEFATGDLHGRHQVRVVIDGVENSPLYLGNLQLDRAAPASRLRHATPAGGTVTVIWSQGDDLSGTDPSAPLVAEEASLRSQSTMGGRPARPR